MDQYQLSIYDAAIIVSKLFSNYCYRCHPNNCNTNEKRYYRPDEIINDNHIQYATTHFLNSININDRFPINIFKYQDDLQNFLQNKYNLYPYHGYFVEYNPSITHLPKNQIPKQLDNNNKYYLVSYRVTTSQQCLYYFWESMVIYNNNNFDLITNNDYIGFAIIDINLNIVLETVVDIKGIVTSHVF